MWRPDDAPINDIRVLDDGWIVPSVSIGHRGTFAGHGKRRCSKTVGFITGDADL